MATAPANDTLEAKEIETIVSIRVADINAADRLRPVDPVWASALGAIMAREGQRTPIEVCRLPGRTHWTLVTGGHRHAGALAEGIEYLKAIVVGADRAERRMREVSENLWRKELDPIDRAAFVAEIHALLKAKVGSATSDQSAQQVAANARWQKALATDAADASATIADAYGLDAQIGAQLGFSERTVRNDLLLHRRLAPSLIAALREVRHPIAGNATQLRALAKLDEAQQRAVVRLLVDGAKTVSDALATIAAKPPVAAEDKRLSAFVGAFARMGTAEKFGALRQLPLPNGVKVLLPGDHHALLAAVRAGFAVATALCDGEPVEDEDIAEAAGQLQQAIDILKGAQS